MRKLLLSATLTCLAAPAFADDVAVLIGNDRYEDLRRVSDATDILGASDELADAGFTVTRLSNATIAEMRSGLEAFAQEAGSADRLVVALSGRFVTDEDRTWFLAGDADQPTPFGLDDAVSVDTILQVLARTPGQAILVLGYGQGSFDSYGRYLREGVGRLDIPQGVTVIYGEPDRVDNVLTSAIGAAGVDVMEYARGNRRLSMLGYQPESLVMTADGQEPAPAPAPAPVIDRALAAWNIARATNTADSYREFIFAYPSSRYTAEARERLDEIENDPVRLGEQFEDALNLTRNQRRAIQQDLTLLGYDTRGVDGIFGRGSRSAIRNWQQDNGFAQTSYLTSEQIARLDAQASRRQAEIDAEEAAAREDAERRERAYWAETGQRGDVAGLSAYLERYPEGIFADDARASLQRLTADQNDREEDAQARAREDALNINGTLRRLIESRLQGLGYNPGAVDGRFDSNTRRALRDYQSSRGLRSTGYVDQQTLARLLADTFGR